MKYSSKLSATVHVMVLIAINQEKSLSSASIADCGVGINIQLSLQGFYNEIQKTAEGKMNTITLQDIIDTYNSNFFTNNARIAFNTARIITPTSAKLQATYWQFLLLQESDKSVLRQWLLKYFDIQSSDTFWKS